MEDQRSPLKPPSVSHPTSTAQNGGKSNIKACVRSNRKKAVLKCPRSSSAHFYCTISFMDICHGEYLLFFCFSFFLNEFERQNVE